MKQFVADRHTTPGTSALNPVNSPKVPVYDTLADVEADLANLSEGQIVATGDTGDELAQPVDVVEEGNLHAVSSNAVAELFTDNFLEWAPGDVSLTGDATTTVKEFNITQKGVYIMTIRFTKNSNGANMRVGITINSETRNSNYVGGYSTGNYLFGISFTRIYKKTTDTTDTIKINLIHDATTVVYNVHAEVVRIPIVD